ncbi:hypothetical protein Tco_1386634 [Tanacetum coccineum]
MWVRPCPRVAARVSLGAGTDVYKEFELADFLKAQVRILQKSQENGQNRAITDTRRKRVYKCREFNSKKGQKSTQVNL